MAQSGILQKLLGAGNSGPISSSKPTTPSTESDHRPSDSNGPEPARTDNTVILGPNLPVGEPEQEKSTASRSHDALVTLSTSAADSYSTAPGDITDSTGEKNANVLGDDVPLGDTEHPEEIRTGNGPEEEDDETKYPKGVPLAILTFGLCMALFVVALDNTIIGENF